jgi:glycosyl transferase family 25
MNASPKTPCWIITLDPDAPPVRELVASLAAQGVRAKTIAGVDGRQGMPALQAGERLAPARTRRRHLCELTSSEVGCYLAHLRALRQAYDEGLEHVCIMEDDIAPEAGFAAALAELEQMPETVEMVRLMGLKVRKRKVVAELSDGRHRLVRHERGCVGAQGYLINRSGMRKLLDFGSTIVEPIDKLYDHFWEFDLRLYGVEPHLIWEVPGDSSVRKSGAAKPRAAAWLHALHAIDKLSRSITRHYYLWRHRADFYPAGYPDEKPGRTARMKFERGAQTPARPRP